MMGGKVIVQSVFGSGSKFTIMLNQKIVDKNKDSNTNSNVTDGFNQLNFEGKRVLIVDDNIVNAKVATKLLQKYNIIVEEAFSGEECLNKIKDSNYDLIFMDDMMPKMSGVETLHKLKENNLFNIPTVALTANALVGEKEKYLKEGFNGYLAKPINKVELEGCLKRYLSKKRETINFDNTATYVLDFSKNKTS